MFNVSIAHEGPDIEDHYEYNYFIPKTIHSHSSEDLYDGLRNNHRYKSITTLVPKPLKDIVIEYKNAKSWERTLHNFYKEHCLSGLSKDKWNKDIEKCYYVDSPLENEEFFIIKYSDAEGYEGNITKYNEKGIGKNVTMWRAALRGKNLYRNKVAEFNTLNGDCSYMGGGGDCVFPDSFISYWNPMMGNGCAYTTIAKKGLSYGSPYGSENFAYSYSSCGKGLADNRIKYKNGCNLYDIEDPFGDPYTPG